MKTDENNNDKKKIKVAFVKFAGLCAGGTERFIQTIAANLPKDEFDVDYYYTNAAPYLGSDYKHSDNDVTRGTYLRANGVNLIPVKVEFKDVRRPTHDWVNTDFWELFDESRYDIVQTGRAGHSEYPFTKINNTWIVDAVTLPGQAEVKSNVFKTIHISEYQKNSWVAAGGKAEDTIVLPIVSDAGTDTVENLRGELGFTKDDFVYGLHQRDNDGIFSPIALQAFARVNDTVSKFVVMGGSKKYTALAETLGLGDRFVQLDHTGDPERLDMFLNTLNVYTHARADGETFGLCIAEAMAHGLPIISHVAPAMGHVETIGGSGKVFGLSSEYIAFMNELKDDPHTWEKYSKIAIKEHKEKFSVPSVMSKVIEVYKAAASTTTADAKDNDDFWNDEWD